MSGLPQYVDPLRLAETRESIAGQLAIGAMPRLREALSDDSGTVEFRLNFSRDDQGLVRILGEFSTSLSTVCQRCLGPLQLSLAGAINAAPVAADEGEEAMPTEAEPLVMSEGRIHLPGFIEDEVMLALPIAPVHDEGKCRRSAGAGPDPAPRARPFEALKDMNIRKN